MSDANEALLARLCAIEARLDHLDRIETNHGRERHPQCVKCLRMLVDPNPSSSHRQETLCTI
jgi:hypothetical protein